MAKNITRPKRINNCFFILFPAFLRKYTRINIKKIAPKIQYCSLSTDNSPISEITQKTHKIIVSIVKKVSFIKQLYHTFCIKRYRASLPSTAHSLSGISLRFIRTQIRSLGFAISRAVLISLSLSFAMPSHNRVSFRFTHSTLCKSASCLCSAAKKSLPFGRC